jgi:hypothetical protein
LRACDPNAWLATSPNTHHRISWATRNTNISFLGPGGGAAAYQTAFGGVMGCDGPLSRTSPKVEQIANSVASISDRTVECHAGR